MGTHCVRYDEDGYESNMTPSEMCEEVKIWVNKTRGVAFCFCKEFQMRGGSKRVCDG